MDLRGSSKALTGVNIAHRVLYQCATSIVKISHGWSHEECTNQLSELFSVAFAYATANHPTHSGNSIWAVLGKQYQTLQVVPSVKPGPAGSDILKFRFKGNDSYIVYIGNCFDLFRISAAHVNICIHPNYTRQGLPVMEHRKMNPPC